MKKITCLLFISYSIFSCNNNSKTEVIQEVIKPSLIGVWEMTDRYFYENGKLTDSIKVTTDRRGIKIFTKTKYMWSGKPLPEAKEYFAFGTYTKTDTTFTEKKEYTSNAMKGHAMESTMKLILNKNTYTQIHFDSTGVFYAEKYKRLE